MNHSISKSLFHNFLLTLFTLLIANYAHVQNDRYNPEMFEQEGRDDWQMPGKVIEAIGLKEGDSIADIGGGSGYFSRPFAHTVGENGVVYCCDLATNLMDYLQEQAKKENITNLVTVYAATDRPMLPPNSVDHIFFCNTNHHLENRVEYYTHLKSLLKPGGQVVVVDWKNKKQKVGPGPGHTKPKSLVLKEMKEAGWQLVREENFLPYQYFLIFKPKS